MTELRRLPVCGSEQHAAGGQQGFLLVSGDILRPQDLCGNDPYSKADRPTLVRRGYGPERIFAFSPSEEAHLRRKEEKRCRWLNTPFGSDAFADRHFLSQLSTRI